MNIYWYYLLLKVCNFKIPIQFLNLPVKHRVYRKCAGIIKVNNALSWCSIKYKHFIVNNLWKCLQQEVFRQEITIKLMVSCLLFDTNLAFSFDSCIVVRNHVLLMFDSGWANNSPNITHYTTLHTTSIASCLHSML